MSEDHPTPPKLPDGGAAPPSASGASTSSGGKRGVGLGLSLAILALSLFRLWSSLNGGSHSGPVFMPPLSTRSVPVTPQPTAPDAIALNWRARQVVGLRDQVLAGSARGYALLSDDGGERWHLATVADDNADLGQAAILEDGRLLLLDEGNRRVYASGDHGASWTAQDIRHGSGKQRDDVSLDDLRLTRKGLLLAWTGEAYESSDDLGQHWHVIGQGMAGRVSETASADSASRAGKSSESRKMERAFTAAMQSTLARAQGGSTSPYAYGLGASLTDQAVDEDLALSADLTHWLYIKNGVIGVSHDEGKSFQTSRLEPAWPSHRDEQDGSTLVDSKQILASDISDDGQMVVAVFGDSPSRIATGTMLDDIDRTGNYQVYVSRDGGKQFSSLNMVLTAYDVGGVQIADATQGSFYVFHSGLSGVSFYDGQSATLHTYPSGGYAYSSAAFSGKYWLFSGSLLARLGKDGLLQLTTDVKQASCTPWQLQDTADRKILFGVDRNGCVSTSADGGQHWQAHLETKRLLGIETTADDDATFVTTVDADGRLRVGVSVAHADPGNGASADDTKPSAEANTYRWVASVDGGDHWNAYAPSSSDSYKPPRDESSLSLGSDIGASYMLDCPTPRRTSHQACIATNSANDRVYVSADGGKQWRLLNIPYAVSAVGGVRITSDGQKIVVATDVGVVTSTDGGLHFQYWNPAQSGPSA